MVSLKKMETEIGQKRIRRGPVKSVSFRRIKKQEVQRNEKIAMVQ